MLLLYTLFSESNQDQNDFRSTLSGLLIAIEFDSKSERQE